MTFDPTATQTILSGMTETFNKYIVAPVNLFGVGGFIFDIDAEATATLRAEITDHYTESNVAVQDHIAINPKRFVLKYHVGEVVDVQPQLETLSQTLPAKLTALAAFLPNLAAMESQVLQTIQNVPNILRNLPSNVVNNPVDFFGLMQGVIPQVKKQQQAFEFFKALFYSKALVSLQTPFEFVNNMGIEAVIATQDAQDIYSSEFTIMLKEMRFASTFIQSINPNDLQGRTAQQSQGVVTAGSTPGIDPAAIPKLPFSRNPPSLTFGQSVSPPIITDMDDLIDYKAWFSDAAKQVNGP